jgi:hypothetical protein
MFDDNYDEYEYKQEEEFLSYDNEGMEDVEPEDIDPEVAVRANSFEQVSRWSDSIGTRPFISGLLVNEIESLRKACDEVTAKYRLLHIMRMEGVQLRRGAKGGVANCPSPIHPLRSASLWVEDLDSDYFVCEQCGANGGVLEFIGLVHGVASLAEQFRLLTETTLESKIPEGRVKRFTQIGKCRREEIFGTVAGTDRVAFTYQALVGELECRESHYQEIRRQYSFMSDERFGFLWRAKQYRSLPSSIEERTELCATLREMGLDLNHVPGFFRIPEDAPGKDMHGHWCFGGDRWGRRVMSKETAELGLQGFLVPIRDLAGSIVGLELYNDPPPSDSPISVRQLWPQRRVPLLTSHANHVKSWSATGGARLHYALPPHDGYNIHPNGVVITDGALRADVIAARYDAQVLGVPQFGFLIDETLEAVSRFKMLLVIADRADAIYVKQLCATAQAMGVKAETEFHDFPSNGLPFDFSSTLLDEQLKGEVESNPEPQDDSDDRDDFFF